MLALPRFPFVPPLHGTLTDTPILHAPQGGTPFLDMAARDGTLSSWSLEPSGGHSHFVLLKRTDELGEDSGFLVNTIVDAVRGGVHRDASTAVPGVVLFVCGGAEEKEMLLRFVALGVPIVVLEGTGGYADEISGLRASIAHNRSERRTGIQQRARSLGG